MEKIIIKCDEDHITVGDMIKKKTSMRQYKSFRYLKATFYLNGIICKTYDEVKALDTISIEYEAKEKEVNWPLYGCNTEIIYEDDNYLVANKRSGLLCIPIKADPFSLYQEIMYYLKDNNQTISIINRLDRETSGLCLIAKNRLAANRMSNTHLNMIRKYLCLTDGIYEFDKGTIDNYIYKDEFSNKRFVGENGKRAISDYQVIKRFKDKTLVEYILKTGRTHQIRVHTASIGHPIVGDILYGGSLNNTFYLKSYYLEYIDPFTNQIKSFKIGGFDYE